jgi:hypothetical protein
VRNALVARDLRDRLIDGLGHRFILPVDPNARLTGGRNAGGGTSCSTGTRTTRSSTLSYPGAGSR